MHRFTFRSKAEKQTQKLTRVVIHKSVSPALDPFGGAHRVLTLPRWWKGRYWSEKEDEGEGRTAGRALWTELEGRDWKGTESRERGRGTQRNQVRRAMMGKVEKRWRHVKERDRSKGITMSRVSFFWKLNISTIMHTCTCIAYWWIYVKFNKKFIGAAE